MKALVVYDSLQGNTKKIAEAVAEGIAAGAKVASVSSSEAKDLRGIELLVIGSPILGGKATPATQAFLAWLPKESAAGLSVATFDTRLKAHWVKVFGRAAEGMADAVKQKGATLRASPEGFLVKGRNGPLVDGEVARAVEWGRKLAGA